MNRMTRTLMLSGAIFALPLAARATPPAASQHSTTAAKTAKKTTAPAARSVDLNGATREQLMQLPGVTDTVADAIIAGRPYSTRGQLLDKKIVDPAVYKKIARHLSVKPAPKDGGQK